MKREEAVRIIKECKEKGFKHTFYTLNEYHTALDIAIKALEQEPKTGHWIEDAKTYYEELSKRGLGVDEYTQYSPS